MRAHKVRRSIVPHSAWREPWASPRVRFAGWRVSEAASAGTAIGGLRKGAAVAFRGRGWRLVAGRADHGAGAAPVTLLFPMCFPKSSLGAR